MPGLLRALRETPAFLLKKKLWEDRPGQLLSCQTSILASSLFLAEAWKSGKRLWVYLRLLNNYSLLCEASLAPDWAALGASNATPTAIVTRTPSVAPGRDFISALSPAALRATEQATAVLIR